MSLRAVRLEEGRRREGELCYLGRDRAAALRGYFSAWITLVVPPPPPPSRLSRAAQRQRSPLSPTAALCRCGREVAGGLMAAMRKLNLHVRKWYKDVGGVWARLRCRTVYSIVFLSFSIIISGRVQY